MAIILRGEAPLWGVFAPQDPAAHFLATLTVSVSARDHIQLNWQGKDVGLVAYASETTFTANGELKAGNSTDGLKAAAGTLVLPFATGGVPWMGEDDTLSSMQDAIALPASNELLTPSAAYPYIRNFETSASRDGARQVSMSGNFYEF